VVEKVTLLFYLFLLVAVGGLVAAVTMLHLRLIEIEKVILTILEWVKKHG